MAKAKLNWYQTLWKYKWVYLKRIFRAFVSQIPTILAAIEGSTPPELLPLFVAFGAFLVAVDKYLREEGYYNLIPFF